MASPRMRALSAVGGAGAALAAVLVLTIMGQDPQASSTAPTAAALRPSPMAPATTAASRVAPAPVATAIRIPSIGVTSTLIPLGLNADGTVQVPSLDTPGQAGWYRYGPSPGEPGPAVVLGHVDGSHKAGVFYRLHDLRPGDTAEFDLADGTHRTFVITRLDQQPKDAFPTAAVYGETPDPELRLITCGGAFDRAKHSYVDNVIVYAVLRE
ncbi:MULTISPECIES: class F sortase [Amycolatopsis]|uniref:Class F sortase n=2 Tax=Pseudonocardiaceae TaxID=2070 RepID=A0ABW5I7N4_9PSEU